MLYYQYKQSDQITWLKNLSKLLNTKLHNNCLTVPEFYGKGIIYACNLKNGMSFMYLNVLFHQDIIFDRLGSDEAGLVLYFNEVKTTGYYRIQSKDQEINITNEEFRTVLLHSSRFPLTSYVSTNTHMRLIGIKFSEKLVRQFMRLHNVFYLRTYTKNNLMNATEDYLTPQIQKLLQEVYDSDVQTPLGRLVLFNRVLLLIEKYLQLFILRELPASRQYIPNQAELENLEKIEAFLSSIPEDFPPIQQLARMAMMSSTKLKQRFKEVYGMKLYEYYNHHRMTQAKLLLESGVSVKEAAARIGFNDSGNFSKSFKKEFGVPPSQIKSKQII